MKRTHCHRRGLTAFEITTALAVLTIAGMLIARLATSIIAQRAVQENREIALTFAENLLETAPTIDAKELANWAAQQKLPVHLIERWPQCAISVTVEPEKEVPTLRRVTVTIRWTAESPSAPPPVTLSAWIAEGPQ